MRANFCKYQHLSVVLSVNLNIILIVRRYTVYIYTDGQKWTHFRMKKSNLKSISAEEEEGTYSTSLYRLHQLLRKADNHLCADCSCPLLVGQNVTTNNGNNSNNIQWNNKTTIKHIINSKYKHHLKFELIFWYQFQFGAFGCVCFPSI